jgi:DNA-binding response OmpR family regulator
MTCRVLVVAGRFGRAKHLERLLVAASFDVAIATTEADALAAARDGLCQVAVLDSTGLGPDPFVLCRVLKGTHVPVLVTTADFQPLQRLRAMDSGADECLSLPAPDALVLARVGSLAELARLNDQVRVASAVRDPAGLGSDPARQARVLVLDPEERSRDRLAALLASEFRVDAPADPDRGFRAAGAGHYDVAVVGCDGADMDGLTLLRHLRLSDPTRALRIVLLANHAALPGPAWRGLADDMLLRPVDRIEALARVRLAARKTELTGTLGPFRANALGSWHQEAYRPARRQPPDRFAA